MKWQPGTLKQNRSQISLALAILFFLQGTRELVGSIYNSNLATMSINSSIIYLLAFVSPVLFTLGLRKLDKKRLVLGLGLTMVVSRLLLSLGPASGFYLFLAFLLVSATLLFIRVTLGFQRPDFFIATASAVCLDMALRMAGMSFDISIYGIGQARYTSLLVSLPLALSFLYALRNCEADAPVKYRTPKSLPLMGIGSGLALFVYFSISGFPNVIIGWTGANVAFIYALSGLFMGFAVLLIHIVPRHFESPVIAIASAIAFATIFGSLALVPDNPGLAFPLSATPLLMAVMLNNNMKHFEAGSGKPRLSLNMIFAGLVFVSFMFVSVLTLTWAHVPGTGFLRDTMSEIIFSAALAFSLLTLYSAVARFRKKGAKAVSARAAGFAAICSSILLISCLTPALVNYQGGPSEPAERLLIMTYNVHQGYGMDGLLDPWEILEPIAAVDPDIIVLQESETNRISSMNVDLLNWLAVKLDMHYYSGPSTGEQIYGLALLSKYPIIDEELYYLESIEDQRMWFRCLVDVGTRELAVYGIHMGLSTEDRISQTNQVIDRLEGEAGPFILAGDFNTWPNETMYSDLTTFMDDAWVLSGHDPHDPAGYTFDSLTPGERIDYIFVSRDLSPGVLECDVLKGRTGSDHLPVWAILDI